MKKYIFSFIFALCLLFSISYSTSASTSSSVAYVEYLNETEGLYGSDITIPSVTDTKQDGVNIATGDLNIKETDLYLPGKNGLDLEIVRSINSSEVEAEYRYLDRMVSRGRFS